MKHYFRTLREFQEAIKILDGKGCAYRTEANPETNTYWYEIIYINGEIIKSC